MRKERELEIKNDILTGKLKSYNKRIDTFLIITNKDIAWKMCPR